MKKQTKTVNIRLNRDTYERLKKQAPYGTLSDAIEELLNKTATQKRK